MTEFENSNKKSGCNPFSGLMRRMWVSKETVQEKTEKEIQSVKFRELTLADSGKVLYLKVTEYKDGTVDIKHLNPED